MPDSSRDHQDPAPAAVDDPRLPLGMPATRKLSADELASLALSLLAQEASYGSQLSERIAQLSSGFYHPSPGVLYPALKHLTDQGLLAQQRQGRRKYYRVTTSGHTWLKAHEATVQRIETRLRSAGRKLIALRSSMSDVLDDDAQALPLAQDMLDARMDLKAALHETRHVGPDAQRRILRLLQETAQRIRAETADD